MDGWTKFRLYAWFDVYDRQIPQRRMYGLYCRSNIISLNIFESVYGIGRNFGTSSVYDGTPGLGLRLGMSFIQKRKSDFTNTAWALWSTEPNQPSTKSCNHS